MKRGFPQQASGPHRGVIIPVARRGSLQKPECLLGWALPSPVLTLPWPGARGALAGCLSLGGGPGGPSPTERTEGAQRG